MPPARGSTGPYSALLLGAALDVTASDVTSTLDMTQDLLLCAKAQYPFRGAMLFTARCTDMQRAKQEAQNKNRGQGQICSGPKALRSLTR